MMTFQPSLTEVGVNVASGRDGPVAVQRTAYSKVDREVRNGRVVYVKQYLEGDWGCTGDIVRARVKREAEVVEQVAMLPHIGRRLGAVHLVSADPIRATLVTEAAPGKPLSDYLGGPYRRVGPECLRAMWLTGRWLRVFHALPVRSGDGLVIGEHDPGDLMEYCDIRLRKTRSLGYSWMTEPVRRRVLQAVGQLVEAADTADRGLVWSHHDYSAGNVLWDGARLTGIDFAMARLDVPLLDVAYFIHRLQMLPIYFPWKRWPIAAWKRAFLRGYGRPDAEESPMYRALMIRHLLCRLQTYVRRPPKNLKQKLHRVWILRCVRAKLLAELGRDDA